MPKKKSPKQIAAADVTAGQSAYALALEYTAQLTPRLPPGTIANLAADLTTLGFPPAAPTPAPTPTTPAPAAPPTLAVALANAESLISAIQAVVRAATTKTALRKEYDAGSKAAGHDVKRVLATATKIVDRATAQPAEALTLGILPADIVALQQAILQLNAAETAAHGTSASGKITQAAKRAAQVGMDKAIVRIAGAGTIAFALVPTTRALFEALPPKR